MKCPNCNQEMENKTYNYYTKTENKDIDCLPRVIVIYACSCGMEYIDKEWLIPSEFYPTEKQKNTVGFIVDTLYLDSPEPLTKQNAWNFISENFEKAKEVSKRIKN